MRIDIVGLPASGKSTLATAIEKKLSIPHIHIDRFWFEYGGKQGRHDTPHIDEVRAKVKERILKEIAADDWVSDGVYLNAQDAIAERADLILFLDIPLRVRLYNHAKRAFFEPKRHAHLTLRDEITFFREIIRREKRTKPKLLEFISSHPDKVKRLVSRREVNRYLESL